MQMQYCNEQASNCIEAVLQRSTLKVLVALMLYLVMV